MSQAQMRPNRGAPPGTPRWVKVLVIIFLLLVVLVIVLHLAGIYPGGHHMSSVEYWFQQL